MVSVLLGYVYGATKDRGGALVLGLQSCAETTRRKGPHGHPKGGGRRE